MKIAIKNLLNRMALATTCALMLNGLNAYANVNKPTIMPANLVESSFFHDTTGSIPWSRKKTLKNVAGDDSANLQNLINTLSNQGGGVIFIPAGQWTLGEIKLESNIHLYMNPSAIIKPKLSNLANKSIFILGYDGKKIQNVSIRSTSGSQKYSMDLSSVTPEARIFPFNIRGIENFAIGGVFIKDNKTVHSSLNFGMSKVNGNWIGAKKGWVKNVTVQNAHGGYGAVQVRVGEKILFKNINSLSGGITLRIETDAHDALGGAAPLSVTRISEISAFNIGCNNGNAALMVQPWDAKNGWFDVQKVWSNSCGASARIDRAFVEWQTPSGQFTNPNNLPVGSFDNDSRITDISATYGTNSQVKAGTAPFVPCALRNLLSKNFIPNMNTFYSGPSISPLLYAASSTNVQDARFYNINVPTWSELNSKSHGFPSASKVISRDNQKIFSCN